MWSVKKITLSYVEKLSGPENRKHTEMALDHVHEHLSFSFIQHQYKLLRCEA